ncbi:MAG: HEAT repeat domain-containing protein [Asgard group archaeon]|nr:HEAT repeat domain-containing protein [Asgard group archaeon]
MISVNSECPIVKNISLLKDSDPKVRRNAAEMLGRAMHKNAVKPLIEALEKEANVEVRRTIVLSLSLLGGNEVYPILLRTLKDDADRDTRRNAAGGLRFFREKIDASELVALIIKESDKSIRDVLVSTVIFLRDKTLVPDLIKSFRKIKKQEIRECLLEIIGSHDSPDAKKLLCECASSTYDDEIRVIAARAMVKMDEVKFIPTLYEIYDKDSNQELRDFAYKSLNEISVLLGYSSVDQLVLEYIQKAKEE